MLHRENAEHTLQSITVPAVCYLLFTRSLGALRAPTSSWGPFGPRLRPSRPSGAQAARPTQVIHPLNPTKPTKKNLFFKSNDELSRFWQETALAGREAIVKICWVGRVGWVGWVG